jgi:hypothetical protein
METATGISKMRPALVLASLPGTSQSLLLCGISTQVADVIDGWDDIVEPDEPRFAQMGLKRRSAVRLSYLLAIGADRPVTRIGGAPLADILRLRRRLQAYLADNDRAFSS